MCKEKGLVNELGAGKKISLNVLEQRREMARRRRLDLMRKTGHMNHW